VASLRDVVVDARHPASLARFWAGVLDGYRVAPYDDAELRRLAALGIEDPEDDPSVLVESAAGGPRYFFTRVPEGKVVKNRVHLDLDTDDHPRELARLLALGATVAGEHERWVQLRDPEGNEFCLFR